MPDGLINRSVISKLTVINEKQQRYYLTGHRVAREAQNKKIATGTRSIHFTLEKWTRMFSKQDPEKVWTEIRDLLSKYFMEKASEETDDLFDKKE